MLPSSKKILPLRSKYTDNQKNSAKLNAFAGRLKKHLADQVEDLIDKCQERNVFKEDEIDRFHSCREGNRQKAKLVYDCARGKSSAVAKGRFIEAVLEIQCDPGDELAKLQDELRDDESAQFLRTLATVPVEQDCQDKESPTGSSASNGEASGKTCVDQGKKSSTSEASLLLNEHYPKIVALPALELLIHTRPYHVFQEHEIEEFETTAKQEHNRDAMMKMLNTVLRCNETKRMENLIKAILSLPCPGGDMDMLCEGLQRALQRDILIIHGDELKGKILAYDPSEKNYYLFAEIPTNPKEHKDSGLVWANDELYLINKKSMKFSMRSRKWSEVFDQMDLDGKYVRAVHINGWIYAFHVWDDQGRGGDRGKVRKCSIQIGIWTEAPELVRKHPYYTIAVVGTSIIVIRGLASNLVDRLDTLHESQGWQLGSSMRDCRWDGSAASVDGDLLVFGGYDHDEYKTSGLKLNMKHSNKWSDTAPMPSVRHGLGVASIGGDVFVAGGVLGFAAGGAWSKAMERYNIAKDTWNKEPDIPLKSGWTQIVAARVPADYLQSLPPMLS